jgi:hypothetical protein
MGAEAEGEIMNMQRKDVRASHENTETNTKATELQVESSALNQKAVAVLAYFYWEARGCPKDSPGEDWFRAEAELHNRLTDATV